MRYKAGCRSSKTTTPPNITNNTRNTIIYHGANAAQLYKASPRIKKEPTIDTTASKPLSNIYEQKVNILP
jgi:hypothetical protein